MKTNLVLTTIAAAAIAVFAQAASAQAAADSKPTKSGSAAPAGQGVIASAPSTMSDKSRMERKDTTKADRKAGELKPAGDGAEMKDDKADKMKPSTTSRAERKAATKAAVKSGTTQPAGESPTPSAEPAKK